VGESRPVAEPVPLDGRRRARRSPVRRRRIAALGTAAAVILLVAGLVPLLRHTGGGTVATQTAGGGAASSALSGLSEGSVPVFSAPGGYSAAALQSALRGDAAARSAYLRAANAGRATRQAAPEVQRDSGGAKIAPHAGTRSAENSTKSTERGSAGAAGQPPSDLQQAVCVATARKQAGDQGLQPAFFVSTVYRDRPATVLVTVRRGEPGKAVLWAFPIGNCSAPPFARDTVTVTPP
jgi:hypothetical protein